MSLFPNHQSPTPSNPPTAFPAAGTPASSQLPVSRRRSIVLTLAVLGFLVGVGYQLRQNSISQTQVSVGLVSRISTGDRAFFPEDGTPDKALALKAITGGDSAAAKSFLQQSLSRKVNDPESRIYLNNLEVANRNPAKIAVSIPISDDPNTAREILRGVAQAQFEINRTATITHPLSVMITDDGNQPVVAQQLAQFFVDRPEILGVVGPLSSGLTLAAANTYDRGQLVAISPVSSAVTLSNKSPYLFRTLPSDAIAARDLIEHLTQTLNIKTAALYFNSESDYSRSFKGELKRSLEAQGGKIVAEYDLKDPNFSAFKTLQDAQSKDAKAILLAANTGTIDRALQVIQSNQNKLPLLGGDDLYSSKILEVSQSQGKGMVIAVPWHILSPSSKDFATRSRQLWGGEVNWRTATAYDATQALGLGLQQAKTRQELQQNLVHPGFSAAGASRMIVFLPSGDRNVPSQLVQIVPGNRSRFGYDFMPLSEQVPDPQLDVQKTDLQKVDSQKTN